jgi:putative tricarboxylic transport membrane protein
MDLDRRAFAELVLGLGVSVMPASAAFAAAAPAARPLPYPQRVVTLISHSSPGSGSDIFLREMIRFLPRYIAANFIVENLDGGSGARAMLRVANARPDGSVLYATTPTLVMTSLLSKPAKTYRDVQPVVNLFTDSELVYTRVDSPLKTLTDAVEKAKTARGRWGASNPASLERQSLEHLKLVAKVNAAVVSHDGGSDMMINVLNGTLDLGVGETEEIRAQLEAKKVKLLATFNAERLSSYPDVPTAKELGYDVVHQKFRGLAGPKGMPAEILRTWEEASKRLLADPEYKVVYERAILVPNFMAHEEYTAYIGQFAAETETYLKSVGVIR